MSWTVQTVGKPAAAAIRVQQELARYKCSEPEETHKNTIGRLIAGMLASYPANMAVRVNAHGSMSIPDISKAPEETVHSLSVTVEPLYGFVE